MSTKKKKKTTYRGVVTPPIEDAFLRGAALGRAITPKKRGMLKKEPMGPPKSLMQPREQLMVKSSYRPMTRKEIMETMPRKGNPSKPRYGAGGTDNPRKPRYGAGGTNNPKVKPKTAKQKRYEAQMKAREKRQRLYEAQMKAREERQKKDPLGRD